MSSRNHSATYTARPRWVHGTAVFLAISYGLGAPLGAFFEFSRHLLSAHFHYPAVFIYLVCVVQFACAFGVLVRRVAPWAAAVLTVTTLGAIVSHVRIGSPRMAWTAVVYTIVQVWFGVSTWKGLSAT